MDVHPNGVSRIDNGSGTTPTTSGTPHFAVRASVTLASHIAGGGASSRNQLKVPCLAVRPRVVIALHLAVRPSVMITPHQPQKEHFGLLDRMNLSLSATQDA